MSIPLSNIIERVDRSIQEAIRRELVDKAFLPDVQATTDFVITSIDQGTKTLIVTGDASALVAGYKFIIKGNTNNISLVNNDGEYTVVTAVFGGADTTIVVVETPAQDDTDDGSIGIWVYQDNPTDSALFKTAIDAVVTAQGYAIEMFGASNPQAKNLKRVPRIVYLPNRFLPGDLGGSPNRDYALNPATGNFDATVLPPRTSDYQVDIHLISNQTRQRRVMHSMVSNVLPKRGYVLFDDKRFRPIDEQTFFFIENYSYRDLPNSIEGINEYVYLYMVKDLYESECEVVATDIKPITEITMETHLSSDPENNVTDEQDDDLVVI